MKKVTLLLLLLCASVSLSSHTYKQTGCVLAEEDIEIPYGVFTIHRLTNPEEFYFCLYDATTLDVLIYSIDDQDVEMAGVSRWSLSEGFSVPTGGGTNYQCFLDEIALRGIIIP